MVSGPDDELTTRSLRSARTITHHGRKNEKKGFRETDYAALLDAAHQQLGGPIVLVWFSIVSADRFII